VDERRGFFSRFTDAVMIREGWKTPLVNKIVAFSQPENNCHEK
jgi:hypothetical protein